MNRDEGPVTRYILKIYNEPLVQPIFVRLARLQSLRQNAISCMRKRDAIEMEKEEKDKGYTIKWRRYDNQ